jgi:hypothetical protein
MTSTAHADQQSAARPIQALGNAAQGFHLEPRHLPNLEIGDGFSSWLPTNLITFRGIP